MRKSIFDIEIRLNINKEFYKMVDYFHSITGTTYCNGSRYNLIKAINQKAFQEWSFRGTAISCEEYLDNIGLPSCYFKDKQGISEEKFLYYLEFIYNIISFSVMNRYITIENEKVISIVKNLNIIAEKLNYQFVEEEERFLLVKRDADVDSVLDIVEPNVSLLLLEYNDFKVKDNIIRKTEILKAIDKYIEENQSVYSKLDKDSYSSWGYIVNKFGVNHKIEEKYKNISDEERLEWYDKAFYLAIHMIRLSKIKDINQERKDLEK